MKESRRLEILAALALHGTVGDEPRVRFPKGLEELRQRLVDSAPDNPARTGQVLWPLAMGLGFGVLPPGHFLQRQIDTAREREFEELKQKLYRPPSFGPVPPATLEGLQREMTLPVGPIKLTPPQRVAGHNYSVQLAAPPTRRSPASEARRVKNRSARKARRKNRGRS